MEEHPYLRSSGSMKDARKERTKVLRAWRVENRRQAVEGSSKASEKFLGLSLHTWAKP